MRCAGQPPGRVACVRAAVAVVALDELLAPMCGDCVLVAAATAAGAGVALVARALRRPAPGRPRLVIALTCTT